MMSDWAAVLLATAGLPLAVWVASRLTRRKLKRTEPDATPIVNRTTAATPRYEHIDIGGRPWR